MSWSPTRADSSSGAAFPLCIVPMQTIQLLGGREGRLAFLSCARRHLLPDGVLAVALSDELELYDAREDTLVPLPDICERDGIVYSSQPIAVRADPTGSCSSAGARASAPTASTPSSRTSYTSITSAPRNSRERRRETGLRALGRSIIEQTHEYVGSVVVMLGV